MEIREQKQSLGTRQFLSLHQANSPPAYSPCKNDDWFFLFLSINLELHFNLSSVVMLQLIYIRFVTNFPFIRTALCEVKLCYCVRLY